MIPCAIPSTALSDLGCLVGIPPPQGREAGCAVFGQRLRTAEAIPACVAVIAEGKLRNAVEVPEQHAVHRLAGGHLLAAVLGEDYALDQGIDRGVLDAADIARTGPVRRFRAEPVALLVAGRQRLSPDRGGDVEVETAQA